MTESDSTLDDKIHDSLVSMHQHNMLTLVDRYESRKLVPRDMVMDGYVLQLIQYVIIPKQTELSTRGLNAFMKTLFKNKPDIRNDFKESEEDMIYCGSLVYLDKLSEIQLDRSFSGVAGDQEFDMILPDHLGLTPVKKNIYRASIIQVIPTESEAKRLLDDSYKERKNPLLGFNVSVKRTY